MVPQQQLLPGAAAAAAEYAFFSRVYYAWSELPSDSECYNLIPKTLFKYHDGPIYKKKYMIIFSG